MKRPPKPKQIKSIDDLRPDPGNLNAGTERGQYMLETSMERYGAGRGVCCDADGVMIAGSHALEAAREKGFNVVVVPTDGRTLVVTQRTDLRMATDLPARELALADNRSAEVGFSLDRGKFAALMQAGCDFSAFYKPEEFEQILHSLPAGDGGQDVNAPPAARGEQARFTVQLSREDYQRVVEALGRVIGEVAGVHTQADALVYLAERHNP